MKKKWLNIRAKNNKRSGEQQFLKFGFCLQGNKLTYSPLWSMSVLPSSGDQQEHIDI